MATSRSEGRDGRCLAQGRQPDPRPTDLRRGARREAGRVRAAVRAGAGRQPWRDRRPDHPRLPRARDGGGRRLQRGRRRGHARPPRRSSRSDSGRRRRESYLRIDRGRRCGARDRRRRRPPRLRVPRRARRVRRVPSRLRASPSSAPPRRRSRRWATSSPPAARPRGGRAVGARHARAGPVDRPDQVAETTADGAVHRLPAAGQGRRRRRRARHAPRASEPIELAAALVSRARARPPSAFGDGSVYLEREILPARHIEVQLLGGRARQGDRARSSAIARCSAATRSSSRRHPRRV